MSLSKESFWRHFWNRVRKTDTCWVWTGRTSGGYGVILIDRKCIFVHRFAYEALVEPILPGNKVLHKCDNPPCMRPDHLFQGTQADNVADAVQKKRHKNPVQHGEDNPASKLRREDILEIRRMGTAGESKPAIAKRFSTTVRNVNKILQGARWSNIT